jgi:hypothetical protein
MQNKPNVNIGDLQQLTMAEEKPPDTHIYVPIRHQDKPNVKIDKLAATSSSSSSRPCGEPVEPFAPLRDTRSQHNSINSAFSAFSAVNQFRKTKPMLTWATSPRHIHVPMRHQNKANVKMGSLI